MKCRRCRGAMLEQIGRVVATIGDVRITVNRAPVFYCEKCGITETKFAIMALRDKEKK